MQSANQIKQRVISTAKAYKADPELVLGEHDGIMWASNRYWLTPAARVAPLLEEYNLSAGQPCRLDVNSVVRKRSDEGLKPGRLLGKPEDYPAELAPVRLGDGHRAHVRMTDKHPWLAVYQDEDRTVIGLPADDLDWLSDIAGMPLSRPQAFELGPDDQFGEVRVMGKGKTGSAPVAIVADVIRTVKPASWSGPIEDRHDAVTENLGPRIVGLLMSVKLEG